MVASSLRLTAAKLTEVGPVPGTAGACCPFCAVAGIVGAPGSKPLIFSILINDVPSPMAARTAQDRITATLVAFLDASLAK